MSSDWSIFISFSGFFEMDLTDDDFSCSSFMSTSQKLPSLGSLVGFPDTKCFGNSLARNIRESSVARQTYEAAWECILSPVCSSR